MVSFYGTLQAFDPPTMRILWTARRKLLRSPPLVTNGHVYVAGSLLREEPGGHRPATRLYAFNRRSGRLVWSTRVARNYYYIGENETVAGLSASRDLLLVPTHGRLTAFARRPARRRSR